MVCLTPKTEIIGKTRKNFENLKLLKEGYSLSSIIILLSSHAGLEVTFASDWSGSTEKGGKPMAARTWIPNNPVYRHSQVLS